MGYLHKTSLPRFVIWSLVIGNDQDWVSNSARWITRVTRTNSSLVCCNYEVGTRSREVTTNNAMRVSREVALMTDREGIGAV